MYTTGLAHHLLHQHINDEVAHRRAPYRVGQVPSSEAPTDCIMQRHTTNKNGDGDSLELKNGVQQY